MPPNASAVAVVDDDNRVLESLDSLLSSAGYTVHVYSSAEKFLDTRPFRDLDCLVSDIAMPGISGLDLLQIVQVEQPSLPVILITARQEEHMLESARELGARFVIRKPFNDVELLDAIQNVVGCRA
jgi:FixJ family two-component response regulator